MRMQKGFVNGLLMPRPEAFLRGRKKPRLTRQVKTKRVTSEELRAASKEG